MATQSTKETIQIHDGSLRDSLRMLREIGDTAYSVRAMRGAIRFAHTPMHSAMRNRVPYKSPDNNDYHLRDFIRLQLSPKRFRKTAAEFRLGPARETGDGLNGYKIKGGLNKSARAPNYAQLTEAEDHWMERSFDQEAPTFVRLFAKNLQNRAEKALKRKIKKEAAVLR